jgi:hypothetical protein
MLVANMRTIILAVIAVAAVLPVLLRGQRWLRILGVLVLLFGAGLSWMGVQTCERIASEKAHLSAAGPDNPFVQGALAARDAAVAMEPVFCLVIFGLALLAMVPLKAKA